MPGAAGSGGYRQPASPAPASGPGAMSKRTDGGPAQKLRDLPDAQYGENATYRDLQQSAPLAQSPSVAAPKGQRSSAGGAGLGSFGDPTAYPERAITTGLGGSNQAIDMQAQIQEKDLERLRRYLPALVEMANRPDATASFRDYVRMLRAKVG